jgi:tight adherence protein B
LWLQRSERREIAEAIALSHAISRLSVLVKAGVSLRTAWREVVEDSPAEVQGRLRGISERLQTGVRHASAVAEVCAGGGEPWKALSAVVTVADESGAPIAEALWACGESLREEAVLRRQLLALAEGPRLTTWVLGALPVVGLVAAETLGAGAVSFLVGTTLGRILLALSLTAVAGAGWWMTALVSRAFPRQGSGALARELLVISANGGASPEEAVRRVCRVLTSVGSDDQSAGLEALSGLSRRAGIPIAQLARADAQWARTERRLEADEAAARLNVTILIPLGVLVLPAFVVVSVIPVAMGLMGSVVGSTPTPW